MSFNEVRPVIGVDVLPPVLRAGRGRLAPRESVEQAVKNLRRQVLVGVLGDLDHRRIHAGPETLHLLPGEAPSAER